MKPEQSPSSSVGRGVGVLLSRTRALSSSVSRWSRSATGDRADPDVAVLPSATQGKGDVLPSPARTTSWRVKASLRLNKKPGSVKADIMSLVLAKKLKNVRESRITELCEKEGSLVDIDFDNKGLSLDELHLTAVLMLERAAPLSAFSDKQGLTSLFDFVESVRAVYKPNPYHDFRHAVDVMQFMNHLLSCEDIAARLFPNIQPGAGDEVKFMLLIACLCHDAGHDGMTNAFHRKTNSELAQRFGTESTLERLHYSHAESLLESSSIWDILKEVPNLSMDSAQLLDEIRSLILATDMEKHAALLQAFKSSPSGQLLNVLIKISDISNVTRSWEEAKVWARRLEAEMKAAALRSPPSDTPAPTPPPLHQTVIGFSNVFALPLVDALAEAGLQETGRDLRARIERNNKLWEVFNEDILQNPGL